MLPGNRAQGSVNISAILRKFGKFFYQICRQFVKLSIYQGYVNVALIADKLMSFNQIVIIVALYHVMKSNLCLCLCEFVKKINNIQL